MFLGIMILVALAWAGSVQAQPLVLNSPQPLTPSEAQGAVWHEISIFPEQRRIVVDYSWRSATETISVNGRRQQTFVCENKEIPGANIECIGSGDPYPCCGGIQAGTCDGLEDTCFNDVFGFLIPPGAVGQPYGIGFRNRLKNAFRDRVLAPGNDGTFE